MILEGDCFDRLKELDIFMDDYFFDHHPISKENARKRLQSLLKQAELRGEVKGIDKAQLIVESTWGTTDMMTKIRECKSELESELTKLEGDNNE